MREETTSTDARGRGYVRGRTILDHMRGPLGRVRSRTLYGLSGAGLLIAAVLLYPGNPLWDWSRTRVPNTIWVYLSLLPLMIASSRDRERWLRWWADLAPGPRWGLLLMVPLALAALLRGLWTLSPRYFDSLNREWGLIEPLTFWLYWVAMWCTLSWARLRQAQAQEAKPYYAFMVLCGLAVLEECDYFGLIGGLIGRQQGVYVGALHDVLNLWYHAGFGLSWGLLLLGVGLVTGWWLWRRGAGCVACVARELGCPTSLPLLLGGGFLGLAQLQDIDLALLDRWPGGRCRACEEPFELLFAVLLNVTLVLKYARDATPAPGARGHA